MEPYLTQTISYLTLRMDVSDRGAEDRGGFQADYSGTQWAWRALEDRTGPGWRDGPYLSDDGLARQPITLQCRVTDGSVMDMKTSEGPVIASGPLGSSMKTGADQNQWVRVGTAWA